MNAAVLILTEPADGHAVAVELALRFKGAVVQSWVTSDFPSRSSESALVSSSKIRLSSSALESFDPFTVVWNRRPAHVVEAGVLHPADVEFAGLSCTQFRKSFFDLICPKALWVNPHESVRRLTKLLQMVRARDVGLRVPATLFSNDRSRIRAFLRKHSERGVVHKPLTGAAWRDEATHWLPYTASVVEEDLPIDAVLRQAPGIYQERVEKDHELRVTVMGQSVFTAKIDSQSTEHGLLDWRRAYGELAMEEGRLPRDVERRCLALLESLGLVFGCFDFIVTPEGEHVFLEVNQMGQFLFLERYTDLPLLDAFSDFLISGSRAFAWNETTPRIRYSDITSEVLERLEKAEADHVSLPADAYVESL